MLFPALRPLFQALRPLFQALRPQRRRCLEADWRRVLRVLKRELPRMQAKRGVFHGKRLHVAKRVACEIRSISHNWPAEMPQMYSNLIGSTSFGCCNHKRGEHRMRMCLEVDGRQSEQGSVYKLDLAQTVAEEVLQNERCE